MKTVREEAMRLMLIAERKRYLLAMDDAYPDVGMGLFPTVAEQQATEQIDAMLNAELPED